MPTIYIAHGENFKIEYSVILFGEINFREVKDFRAHFYEIDEVIESGKSGKLARTQYLLVLRMCASRD